jgi:WD40 repeat protein/energy-coupling factor transporter ATP-binding protein EcfA2
MARRYALVIGIAQYEKPLSPLTKTVSDATAVAQRLQASGEFQEVVVLTTQPVTANQLDQALETFLLRQATGQDALIYFTGHGITATLGRQKLGVLATSDCVVSGKGDRVTVQVKSPDNDPVTFYRLNELIRQANLSSLVVWLDCCHSENLIDSFITQDLLSHLKDLNRPDLFFITACRLHEQALARRSEAHSFFTGALLAALSSDNARDGVITCNEVFGSLSSRLKGSGQEPRHMGYGGSIPILTITPQPALATVPPVNLHNPYVGLSAFDATTADLFYGRDSAVQELIACLSDRRVLTVIGPSGCGKSSLVKAGLLPQLHQGCLPNSRNWEIRSIRLSDQPLQKLQELLTAEAVDTPQPYLLFIDQFEELFTLCDDLVQQQAFIQALAHLVEQSRSLQKIVLTMRSGFLDRCVAIPEAAILVNQGEKLSPYLITKLSSQEMVEAIAQPAQQHGVTFVPGLVPQMMADVGDEPGSLPLLQFALTKLWETCIRPDVNPILTWEGYQAIGGVQGALEQHADQVYNALHPEDQTFVLQTLIRELVSVPDDLEQEATRRRVKWERLRAIVPAEQLERVLNRTLIAARLLVANEDTVEVAHEALLSKSKLIKTWIDNNRETIRLAHRLESDCTAWKAKQKSDDYLLPSGWLAAIQDWQQTTNPALSPDEHEFLEKSVQRRDHNMQMLEQLKTEAEALAQSETQKRHLTRKNWLLTSGLLAAISASALIFAGLSYQNTQNIRHNEIDTLIGLAENQYKNNQQLEALQTIVKALSKLKQSRIDVEKSTQIIQNIINGISEVNRLDEQGVPILSVSISPDSKIIASSNVEGEIKFWGMDGKPMRTLKSHQGKWVWSIRFSPDGKFLASAGLDGTVHIWEIAKLLNQSSINYKPKYTFTTHGSAYDVSFSQDGQLLASVGKDGVIRLWYMNSENAKVQPIELDTKSLYQFSETRGEQVDYGILSVDINPNANQFLAYGGNLDGSARIWNWKNQKSTKSLEKHSEGERVNLVRFSPDGSKLASVSNGGTINLWDFRDVNRPKFLAEFQGHSGEARAISFSWDNQFLATSGSDAKIKVWEISQKHKEPKWTLQGHTNLINRMEISADKKYIVSASTDGTVRIWDLGIILRTKEGNRNSEKLEEQYFHVCTTLRNYLTYSKTASPEVKKLCEDLK